MTSMIATYNREVDRYQKSEKRVSAQNFVTLDDKKIKWTGPLYGRVEAGDKFDFSEQSLRPSLYRPYTKMHAYFDRVFDHRTGQWFSIFPTAETENRVICVMGVGSKKPFSVLMSDTLPCLDVMDKSQCFPLYWYEESQNPDDKQGRLFDNAGDAAETVPETKYNRRDAISDAALARFRSQYNDRRITKEDIFYYVYGVLSAPEYAARFGDDVKKMLARVPFARDFWAFSVAGRNLGELHVNYEQAKHYPVKLIETPKSPGIKGDHIMHVVEKMKIVNVNREKGIRYNENITVTGIPPAAWEYVVNGKSALEWIVERYQDATDKDSGLRNDCNAWGREHNNPRYPLDLIEKVSQVSVETVEILRGLPELGVEMIGHFTA